MRGIKKKDVETDVRAIGSRLLGRELTDKEADDYSEGMVGYFDYCAEDAYDRQSAMDYFNETFYEHMVQMIENDEPDEDAA